MSDPPALEPGYFLDTCERPTPRSMKRSRASSNASKTGSS